MILVEAERKTPIDTTEPSPMITPSTTSERAPMKQSSSMTVGLACNGSSTPPIPTITPSTGPPAQTRPGGAIFVKIVPPGGMVAGCDRLSGLQDRQREVEYIVVEVVAP